MSLAIEINPEALARVQAMPIGGGSHDSIDSGMCVMEACAYVAGEPWSDEPECACPVIGALMRSWNDSLPDDDTRTRLLAPLITTLVGTRSTPAVEQRRATMAADWLIRTHTPAWLRLAKLESQAALLEALPEITDFAQCPSLMSTLAVVREDAYAAGDAAWDAAWDAAEAAARDAARDAAGDAAVVAARVAAGVAARAAARDAAGAAAVVAAGAAAEAAARAAAVVAARVAAGVAAGVAARAAARAAARDALQLTVANLQTSAVDLVKRMAAVRA